MFRLIASVFALVLVLAACGGGDSSDDGTGDPATTAAGESDDGAEGSGPADLGDFPIPAPPVGQAALTSESGGVTVYTITFPADQYDAVVAFYDEWTTSQPDSYQRTEAESGGVSWILDSDSDAAIIAASPPLEGDDIAFVSLTAGEIG